ncbi:hypothetical protein VF11_29395, partial [Nostoc linckia z14]
WGDGKMGRWEDGEMGRWGDGECGECGECGGKDFFTILPHLPHFLLAQCPMPNAPCPIPITSNKQLLLSPLAAA